MYTNMHVCIGHLTPISWGKSLRDTSILLDVHGNVPVSSQPLVLHHHWLKNTTNQAD